VINNSLQSLSFFFFIVIGSIGVNVLVLGKREKKKRETK
jgi:hypothetical protein